MIKTTSSTLSKIRTDFIGLDTVYTLADGRKTARTYLDSTASTLMMGLVHDLMEEFLDHYANSHSVLHFSAKITTKEYKWAHERILSFLNADPDQYTCFFTGSGTTAGINRLARVFREYRKEKDVVIVSIMEHHSNDLPHRKHSNKVVHVSLENQELGNPGSLDLEVLEKTLSLYKGRVNYVSITGISNVTGIINPIYDIAEIAHDHGVFVIIDGAQMAAHMPVKISGHSNPKRNIDAFVFSGHKTYAPGSPGVVICRKDILTNIEPEEVGGGMVDDVFIDNYIIKNNFPDREEAGTPNIPGAVALAASIEVLDTIGLEKIYKKEEELVLSTMEKMIQIEDLIIYGEKDTNKCTRAGSISFNIRGLDHGFVAAVLNDYFNIAVRNECFCAHPYVKELILEDLLVAATDIPEDELELKYKLIAGMVRASFGIYSQPQDVDMLISSLKEIIRDREKFKKLYHVDKHGNYIHNEFKMELDDRFSMSERIKTLLS